jgi:hypothetical protein
MSKAFVGKREERSPLVVRRIGADDFLMLDGNSTAAGWSDIPCEMADEFGSED